jgi:hypothetical protein
MPTFIDAFGEFRSLRDWSRDPRCSVSLMTLEKRVKSGWPPEEAIISGSDSPADRLRQKIAAFGESKSLNEWELDERSHASAMVIRTRLKNGWAAEIAISTPEPEEAKSPRKVRTYHGKTIPEWLSDPRCTVSRFTLERNLRSHMPIEEALTFRKRRRSGGKPTRNPIEKQLGTEVDMAVDRQKGPSLVAAGRRA